MCVTASDSKTETEEHCIEHRNAMLLTSSTAAEGNTGGGHGNGSTLKNCGQLAAENMAQRETQLLN